LATEEGTNRPADEGPAAPSRHGDNESAGWDWPRIRRGCEVFVAIAAIVVATIAASRDWWPFDESLAPADSYEDPSIWQYLLSDSTTLGFVRLGLIALVLFIVASVPALVVAGRWMKGLGTGGISADDAASARLSIDELQRELLRRTNDLDRLRRERDRARDIARQSLEGLREVRKIMEEDTPQLLAKAEESIAKGKNELESRDRHEREESSDDAKREDASEDKRS